MAGVLEGTVVVDLTSNVAGPYATSILGDLGAEIWKVEQPGDGDAVRGWPPFAHEVSTTFASLNRGKRSVAIDLKTAAGRAALEAMVRHADVVVDSMRPGVLDGLGFPWEVIHEINPRTISCSITAYGRVGPRADEPGFDAVLQAYSGLLKLTGEPGRPPVRVGTGVIDFGTGLWAALGVLGALLRRAETGLGVQVEARLLGTAVAFQVHHLASVLLAGIAPQALGTAQHNSAPYEAIATHDGLVMVGVANDALWRRFCSVIDPDGTLASRPDLETNAMRVANRTELRTAIEALVHDRDAAELDALLHDHGIPSSVIRDIAEVPGDPQVQALGLIRGWGDEQLQLPVLPIVIGDGEVDTGDGVPVLGADTREVLGRCGLSDAEVDAVAAADGHRPASEDERDGRP